MRWLIALIMLCVASPAFGVEILIYRSDEGSLDLGDIVTIHPDGYFDNRVIGSNRRVLLIISDVSYENALHYVSKLDDDVERRFSVDIDDLPQEIIDSWDINKKATITLKDLRIIDKAN